ncbi:MAG: hypothetical protein J3K34DRAFT_520366 [Monoraphidium minutum]|nr:MAG: hypothetical protein J3K34DRAFT_520366 [Monoraphidium minutum]
MAAAGAAGPRGDPAPPPAADCDLSALPPPVLELIAARIDPEFRHALRCACRAARDAANATCGTLVLGAAARRAALRGARLPPPPVGNGGGGAGSCKSAAADEEAAAAPVVAEALRRAFPNTAKVVACGGGELALLIGGGGAYAAAGGRGRSGPRRGADAAAGGGVRIGRSASEGCVDSGRRGSDSDGWGDGGGGSGGGGGHGYRRALSTASNSSRAHLAGWGGCCDSGSEDGGGGGEAAWGGPAQAVRLHVWRHLRHVVFEFDELTDALARRLAAAAPQLSDLGLTLAVGRRAKCQARRLRALRHLPALSRLSCAAPLGPAALAALRAAAGARLSALALGRAPRRRWPGACVAELAQMTALTELRVARGAARTLTHAAPLAALTGLRELSIWLGSHCALPPWSSRPLPDLLPTAAALRGLTALTLLGGLRRPGDASQLALLAALPRLHSLGLHDTVVGPEEVAALARCRALTSLAADSLHLPAGLQGAPPLRRLEALRCNALGLGPLALADALPGLTSLAPLKDTLGPGAYGVHLPLAALEGSGRLRHLGLMLGALRPGRGGGGGGGGAASAAAAAARALAALPRLSELDLIGAAGGPDAGVPGGGAELLLELVRRRQQQQQQQQQQWSGAAVAAAAAAAGGALAWEQAPRPGLERARLMAWAPQELAALGRLLPQIREAAPGLLICASDEWP